MISLKCLSQGSKGNCWILKYNNETLILDAGIPVKDIKRGLDYNLMSVQGACVTHAHVDHSLAVKDLRKMGIQVFTPYECDIRHKVYGSFSVQAFSVPHGNTPCHGFYIKVADRRMIYVTDMEMIPFTFHKQGLTDMVIEVNYQDKYVDLEAENANHKILDHCELKTAIEIVRANQTEFLQNVIITHMGISTANAIECVNEIKNVTNEWVNVDYARDGHEYYL